MEKPVHAKPSLYAFYFEGIKEIGKNYGYNIVLHGSMNRDLDLIALPWFDYVGDKIKMLNNIAEFIGGKLVFEPEENLLNFAKSHHGRMQYVININRNLKIGLQGISVAIEKYNDPQYYIDISIFPHDKNLEIK